MHESSNVILGETSAPHMTRRSAQRERAGNNQGALSPWGYLNNFSSPQMQYRNHPEQAAPARTGKRLASAGHPQQPEDRESP